RLGPGCVCQPVVPPGCHVFSRTKRSDAPSVLSSSSHSGFVDFTFDEISPNLAFAIGVLLKPDAGVARTVPRTVPAYAATAAETAATARTRAHIHRLRIAIPPSVNPLTKWTRPSEACKKLQEIDHPPAWAALLVGTAATAEYDAYLRAIR